MEASSSQNLGKPRVTLIFLYIVRKKKLVLQHHLVTIAKFSDCVCIFGSFSEWSFLQRKQIDSYGGFHHSERIYLHGRIFLWENLYRIVQYSSSSGSGEKEANSEAFIKSSCSPRNTTCLELYLSCSVEVRSCREQHTSPKALTQHILEWSSPLCWLQRSTSK